MCRTKPIVVAMPLFLLLTTPLLVSNDGVAQAQKAGPGSTTQFAFLELDSVFMGLLPSAQGGDAFADRGRRAEQGVVGEPLVGQVFRHVVGATFGQRLLDGRHLLDVARFLPVVAVVRQGGVAGEGAPVDRLRRLDIVADAGRDHVADEEA